VSGEALAGIIAAARRGDPAAHAALVDLYGARLFGFLFRMAGRREDAEDLLQEVFLRLVRMIATYQDDGRFEPWLFRIAANLVRDRIRRLRRRPGDRPGGSDAGEEDRTGELPAGAAPPDATLEQGEARDRLAAALRQLPEPEREVILLRHFSQMSFREIADATGTPLGTALARGHRGLARLRSIMTGDPAKEAGRSDDDEPEDWTDDAYTATTW